MTFSQAFAFLNARREGVLGRARVTVVLCCLFSSSLLYALDGTAQAAGGSRVEVLDSDRSSPELHRQSFDLSDATQPTPTRLVKGKVTLDIIDPFLGDVSLQRVKETGRTTLFEDYAFQVLFAAERAYRFYEEIGFTLPPVTIRLQDPAIPPLAQRSGDTLSFTRFQSLERGEGSVLNIRDATSVISDVVAHEMTHFAQGDATLRLAGGRIGNTSYEGHANLMAALMVGRTDLGVFPGEKPDMRVFVPPGEAMFGRMQGGNYDSYQPFSSVLWAVYQRLLAAAMTESEREARHRTISRLYFDLVAKSNGAETYRDLAVKVIVGLRRARLLDRSLLAVVRQLFYERGLDLSRAETEGYFAGFLVNGKTADRGRALRAIEAKEMRVADATFEIQAGVFDDSTIQWPVTGVLVSESSFRRSAEIMKARLQELTNRGEVLNSERAMQIGVESFIEVGKEGVDLGGAIVNENQVEFDRLHRRVTFTSRGGQDRSKCFNDYTEGNLMLFDARHRMIGQAALPFLCR